MTSIMAPSENKQEAVSFSHVQLYVDQLEDIDVYKQYENTLNDFARRSELLKTLQEKQQLWHSLSGITIQPPDDSQFQPHNRDVIKQLLAGLSFRVTAAKYTGSTRSVLVTSKDPQGVQILVTALEPSGEEKKEDETSTVFDEGMFYSTVLCSCFVNLFHLYSYSFYPTASIRRFYAAHNNRQGIAVLGFLVDNVQSIYEKYSALHPRLIADYDELNKILHVFAYYQEHTTNSEQKQPDEGTLLRFIQNNNGQDHCPLPNLTTIPATFPNDARSAYCDHWVSNVHSRTEFLHTLEDTLGFTPKVDFNAGVVAAGEAQIESTVTGNDAILRTQDRNMALKDQSQVYLPINNALSSVGHVHGFLKEIGQGIQHLASRVEDLVDFVQSANEHRKIFGEGFTFLNIPRSYYGILTETMLVDGIRGDGSDAVSVECAKAIMASLQSHSVMEVDGALDLQVGKDDIHAVLGSLLSDAVLEEYQAKREDVLAIILRSRYINLYSLLRDHVSEENYLRIVLNKILVDVQGEDLLYQIFSGNILQRNAGDEAPFFEYIQRVCSECLDENGCPQTIRPGCGGFGIRNFLTLFLSIEVSKAMRAVADAKQSGDIEGEKYAQTMVAYFTEQMNESNPILTQISDAMTEEGRCRDNMLEALVLDNTEEAFMWKQHMEAAGADKAEGNAKLMECSARYNNMMKALREGRTNFQE
jgi:4-hydroxyphenylpyruvate dioxygenase-like putative hemolysin